MKHILWIFVCIASVQLTVAQPKDSLQLYRQIEQYAQKTKFKKFVHRLIFRPVPKAQKPEPSTQPKPQNNTQPSYQNKIIRKITIETIDPFGYSETDNNKKPKNGWEKLGNFLHTRTKQWIVHDYLLFKPNQKLQQNTLEETERLIQSQRFIRRANITTQPVGTDSVDVTVRVLDSWSFLLTGSFSGSTTSIEADERNFLGLGHEVEYNFKNQNTTGIKGNVFKYSIPNFKNTYIQSYFSYENDFNNNYRKEISLNRNFFSPLTRYAGGIQLSKQLFHPQPLSPITQQQYNFWTGYAFQLTNHNPSTKTITNWVTTARATATSYTFSSIPINLSNQYINTHTYLFSTGITKQRYLREDFLFSFGNPEYIQTGHTLALTTGWEHKLSNRLYMATKWAIGNRFNFGYLSLSAEIGSFFNAYKAQQATIQLQTLYFSPLYDWGNWKFRQFIQPKLTLGSHRIHNANDVLTLNHTEGIAGFDSPTLNGQNRFILQLQTQSYAPGMLWGFKFSPYLSSTLGLIGNQQLFKQKLFSRIGIGVLLSNDYLVFNSFQLSLAYYPNIPQVGDDIIKTNAFKNSDWQLPYFGLQQPAIINYQ